jgi:hypothetical protein
MRVDVRGDYTEENGGITYVKGQIDDAIASNGLVVFMSHVGSTVIYDENGNATNTYLDASADLAVYTEILEYIRGKGYDIEPLMDACQRFANPVDVKDFVVGADGTVQVSKGNVHVVADYNAYTMASLPSQYPQNQITTCQIYDATAPGASTGILTAYVTDTLAYRTYMPKNSATLYLQIKNPNADAWMDWSKCNQKDYTKLSNNKILSTTAPSALPSGVSICVVASSADIPNLPEGVTGTMTAYNLFSGADKAYEEWKPTGSANKYIRYATSTTAWSEWYGGVTDEQIKDVVDAYLTENPQGGEVWEDISSGELTEEVSSIVIDKDSDGNAFNLSKGRLYLEVVGTSTNTVDRGLIKFSHNYRGSGGGAVEMGTLTRSKDGYKEFAMGDYDFSLDGRGVVKYIATQATDQKAFMQLPLTKIYIDGTTENATMMGVGTRWLLRGVRK